MGELKASLAPPPEPFNPLHLQLDSHRDNDTPAGKRECDRKILAELDALVPVGCRFSSHVTVFQIEHGLQISLDSNRCIQQVWLDRATENQDW